jgi:hypothetical protein
MLTPVSAFAGFMQDLFLNGVPFPSKMSIDDVSTCLNGIKVRCTPAGEEGFSSERPRDVTAVTISDILDNFPAEPGWGRTDHGNAAKHRNQTEVEGMHDDSVAVLCRVINGRKRSRG